MKCRSVCALKSLSVALLLASMAAADARTEQNGSPVSVLQENDEITIHSLQVKELSDKTFRLDQEGEVNLPLAGIVKLGGCTPREAEKAVKNALMAYYREPDVEISVASFHVESVSIMGSVGTPGVYPLKGRMSLLEALSAAGGVRGDAGPTLTLTRQGAYGPIPHAGARQLLTGQSVVDIELHDLTDGHSAADNIPVRPHDVISIAAAQMVYVLGNVKKGGGFPLGGRPNISVTQALSLSEGWDPRAAPHKAVILRRGSNAADQLIPVNFKKIVAGKEEDIIMRPNDILFLPSDTMKVITSRTIEAAIQIGTGLAIFHP